MVSIVDARLGHRHGQHLHGNRVVDTAAHAIHPPGAVSQRDGVGHRPAHYRRQPRRPVAFTRGRIAREAVNQ